MHGSDDEENELPMQSEKADLVENIREGNLRNMRPKTRGEPSVKNLDIKMNPQVTD